MACAARRWLARNAAGVRLVRCCPCTKVSACISLVSCLPALEHVLLYVRGPLIRDDLVCLLEALAGCPRLGALNLHIEDLGYIEDDDGLYYPFPDAAAFAKLRSLTELALHYEEDNEVCLADIVSALVPLTGLAKLSLTSCQPAVVPAALAHLKSLQSLTFDQFGPFVLEAGCLDLPNLLSLEFEDCDFEENAQLLPGLTALQRLTSLEFSGEKGPCFMYDEVYLQHTVIVPALLNGLGLLSMSLLHLCVFGLALPHFPLVLTQLVALECLDASTNEFAELPAGITALSRLTELRLGRGPILNGQVVCEDEPLDVRALGDLSGFPALRKLDFQTCAVMLSPVLLGAVRHASIPTICFRHAHPMPECVLMVLQLSRELKRLRRGSVLAVERVHEFGQAYRTSPIRVLNDVRALERFDSFKAALHACVQ